MQQDRKSGRFQDNNKKIKIFDMITKKEFSQAIQDNASVVAGALPAASYYSNGVLSKELYLYMGKKFSNSARKLIFLGDFKTTYRRGYYFVIGCISDSPVCAYIYYCTSYSTTAIVKDVVYLDSNKYPASRTLKLYSKNGSLYLGNTNADATSTYTIFSDFPVEQTELIPDETYEDVTP